MADLHILESFNAFSAGALFLTGIITFIGQNDVLTTANRWLGLFYVILACTFSQLFLESFGIDNPLLIHLLEMPRWAMLPCLYVAVSYHTSPSTDKASLMLHFVPFIIFVIYAISNIIPGLYDSQEDVSIRPTWLGIIVRYFFLGQMLCYWMLCFFMLRKHQLKLRTLASFTEKIDLQWLRYLLLSVIPLIAIRVLSISGVQISSFSPFLYFIGILFLAYATLSQQSIYALEPTPLHKNDETVLTKTFHERLTSEQVDELKASVVSKTQGERLYLDPGLTLSILSRRIGISSHELSYVLNQGIGKSFYQFINELRTEEAKSLLLSDDSKHLDMLGIAIRAGFNSKTTFYTTFKKLTNLTPKQYLLQHKIPPQT